MLFPVDSRRVNSGVSTDRKLRAVNAIVSTRRSEVGLTTHSTRAEIARMSFNCLDAARHRLRPRQFGRYAAFDM
jgi:hypothetical protein